MYQIYNDGSFVPRNVMEELVEEKLDNLMYIADMRHCNECRALVKELALKELPPLYASCVSEDVYARFDARTAQTQADIIVAILHSVDTIRKRSQHCPAQK